jgi:hypothetical protein
MLLDQPGDAAGNDAGFATTGACQHKRGGPFVGDSLLLCAIEFHVLEN